MYASNQISIFYCWILFSSLLFILRLDNATSTCYLKPQLELSITPPGHATWGNNVTIYWYFNKILNGDWIGLYSDEPINSPKEFLLSTIVVDRLTHFLTTKFQVTSDVETLKYDEQTYLGFTAVAWTVIDGEEEKVVSTKLQTYPQWMRKYWKFIKNVPMNEIFLPGTHDSCSYRWKMPDEVYSSLLATIWSIEKKIPLVNNWSLTQNRTIKEQLISGIRYLDIRVRKESNFYWASHGSVIMLPLFQVIKEVIEFVSNTEKEIVVFDVHEFKSSGMLFKRKKRFVSEQVRTGEEFVSGVGTNDNKKQEESFVSNAEKQDGLTYGTSLHKEKEEFVSEVAGRSRFMSRVSTLIKGMFVSSKKRKHDFVPDSRHEEKVMFVNYLKQAFTIGEKKYYVPPSEVELLWRATPDKILDKGRVIISFNDEMFYATNNLDILWPPVHQYWGNKQNLNDLKDYILRTIPKRKSSDSLTSVMAELTANARTILANRNNDLMTQAEHNSVEIHDWFLNPAVAMKTNVLAVDYFTVSGVVRLALIWNERKYFNSSCDALLTVDDDYYQTVSIP